MTTQGTMATTWRGGMLALLGVGWMALSPGVARAASGNLALTATATASSGVAGNARDGSLATAWTASTTASAQWLQYDLGGLHSLSRVEQSFTQSGTWRFKLEASLDGSRWATLVDRTTGAAGQIFGEGVQGTFRYVRLTVTGSREGFVASSRELRVFGTDEGDNLAPGRTVTASSSLAGYEPGKATDIHTATYWVAGSASLPQWLKVDLGSPSLVTGVEQDFKDVDTHRFQIEGSLDDKTWTVLLDGSGGLSGQAFSRRVSGTWRYVRLTVRGSAAGYWASSTEFKVYGFANLALGRSGAASTVSPGYEITRATDSNAATYWCATSASMPQWMTIDLGVLADVRRVEQTFVDVDTYRFKIEGSTDNSTWTTLLDKSAGASGQTFGQDVRGTWRYLRLSVSHSAAGHWASSQEFRVFGTPLERDLALGASASASSLAPGYEPGKAVDGHGTSYWCASSPSVPEWLKVDLGTPSLVRRVEQSFVNSDTHRFKLEGSTDNSTWTTLLDRSSGASGKDFAQEVNGTWRYIRLTVLGSAAGHWASSQTLKVIGVGSPLRARWWEEGAGVMRYYPKYYNKTLNTIASELDDLRARGYGAIELMAPYTGPADVWAGLGATDNYSIDPSIGSMSDFQNLLTQARARGMRVLMFGNVGYARDTASFFIKAQDDNRTNTYSKERMWFHFRATGGERWYWSSRAGAYYYAFWGQNIPSYNFNTQEWRDETRKYIRFWMDKGLDGFALDAPAVYDGITPAINNAHITDVLRAYDTWANSEGAPGPGYVTEWHYNSIQDYELTNWGGAGFSTIIPAIDNQNPDGLENILKNNRDAINAAGGITQTPPSWEVAGVPANKRLLEIATLTTVGTLFYLHNGQHTLLPHESVIPTWSQADQAKLWSLMRAQASYKALAPTGARVKLPTQDNRKFYAFTRTNKDGSVKALVILNYQASSQTVTVNLTNTGLQIPQTPVDLLTGSAAPAISSASYSVTLPAYGYTVLGVD
ncbi:discoidin domain-containing protein [Melittangium boletus]|uniref:discoidin domain-containing protein n=1 Tax=Melittangium boletus TaxID=83453 RepID=UPI003DA2F9AA